MFAFIQVEGCFISKKRLNIPSVQQERLHASNFLLMHNTTSQLFTKYVSVPLDERCIQLRRRSFPILFHLLVHVSICKYVWICDTERGEILKDSVVVLL